MTPTAHFNLRDYQEECIQAVIGGLNNSPIALVQLPTGSGKTIIFAELIRRLLQTSKTFTCNIIVPKNLLILQTKEKLISFIDESLIGIYCAEYGKDIHKPIIISSVQSLVKATDMPNTKLMIIDECHWANMEEDRSHKTIYNRLLRLNKETRLLGMTATPIQHNQLMFGDDKFWDQPIYKKTIIEMTNDGYLCPMVLQSTLDKPDLSGIRTTGDDYNQKDLAEMFLSDSEKIDRQVEDALDKCTGREKVIWMCVSIKHAEAIHSRLDDATIIHSRLSNREEKIELFKTSKRHLVTVLIASEGFDYDRADCLVMMRPTRSIRLYLQAAGRVLRPHKDKKDALLLDYGNVVDSLGSIYHIKLSDIKPRIKMCIHCGMYSNQDAAQCFNCGEAFKVMCKTCMEMKPYGETCCPISKEIDALKNLTLIAHSNNKIEKVNRLEFREHVSKAGNLTLRIDYFKGLFNRVASEYYPDWKFRNLLFEVLDEYEHMTRDEFIKNHSHKVPVPYAVKLEKNGKWWNIVGCYYEE